MSAGYGEELICRLLFLPLVLALTKNRWLAILSTGLLFTAMHGFDGWPHFFVRLLIPGCAFSAAAIFIGPTFAVIAHSTAHLLIPALFTG
jgi:membrane protease YdiL (CAAX protease family)